jgi:hypothetical protein
MCDADALRSWGELADEVSISHIGRAFRCDSCDSTSVEVRARREGITDTAAKIAAREAEHASDPADKASWLKLAEEWLKLAEEEGILTGTCSLVRPIDRSDDVDAC